jgi:two-component system, chemotaxis family, protein-glutamate methylesterase/glutaminase
MTLPALTPSTPIFPATAKVVALAASAGGLKALGHVLTRLPREFEAALLVVQHLDPHRPSHLAAILGRHSQLLVRQAEDQDHLLCGVAFVAPPDAHLIVSPEGIVTLSHQPPVHHVRPSADQLFRSIAESFGPRAIAVVLTGMGLDGAAAAQVVRQAGGVVIVQDEASSEFFGMPRAAIAAGDVDQILPLEKIPATLIAMTQLPGAP